MLEKAGTLCNKNKRRELPSGMRLRKVKAACFRFTAIICTAIICTAIICTAIIRCQEMIQRHRYQYPKCQAGW